MIPELVKAMDKQCDLRELRSQTADREFQAIARKQLSLDGLRPLALSIAKQVEFLMIACLLLFSRFRHIVLIVLGNARFAV